MIKEGNFGVQEGICLVTITIIAKSFYTSLGAVARDVGTTGWYMTLISAGTSMVAFTFICYLLKLFPDKNIMEIYDIAIGKLIGFFLSAILFGWLMFISAINLREYVEVIRTYTMPLSPTGYLLLLFFIGATFYSFWGLETIARFAKLVSYFMLVGFVAVILLESPNFRVGRLFPIFGYGIGTTLQHGISRSSAYGEVIIIGVFASSLNGYDYIKKIGYTSIILSGMIISSTLLVLNLTFPYTVAAELTAPFYVIGSIIHYGRFFQRLESIFLFIWNISSFISITTTFYSSILIYCHMFNINDKRPLIIPFSVMFYMFAMLPNGIIEVAYKLINFSREYGWAFFYLPPIFALIIALFRRKRGVRSKKCGG